MRIYKYKLSDGYLVPDENGNITIFLENNLIMIYDDKGNELKDVKFKYLKDEGKLLDKLRYLANLVGMNIDERTILAYPNFNQRILMLNKLMGKIFEDYVYTLLSSKYKVTRQKELYPTLYSFTFTRWSNRPDFIVENKVVVEAKVSKNNYQQTLDYSKYFKKGIVVFPFTGECRVPRNWLCFFNLLKEKQRFYLVLESLLSSSK
ncbi:hypothetical protein BFU36_05720 [Sulfolobus sp. A20]|uniref:hypothetical protein n=1 Tax=Sulfolobaceae TaxID=118883 RepID=UPI0008461DAE|nr:MULTISPECIES: hypothetical protein [unclassified Sulfolobus]TRM77362.1 hypothetical protein DJ532_04820 [Sulfolobus sp. A20-N-F8]TRM85250.1 hypothetical protein DJ522_01490 [Sulfolobus sp. F3]TRM94581.1 hypothetical protein DJ526_02145 [Sulfolobus sp. A20-N-G8]TRN00656.1 hypothetical protein DJ527_06885 [Sulfolobus sp. F1]TRN04217.1 hypothetical protein DJ530_01165 [Sulfolobus sp. E1]